MLLRASETIVALPNAEKVICYDYVEKKSVECAIETLYWLSCFKEWTTTLAVAKKHPLVDSQKLTVQLKKLHDLGLLYDKKSYKAKQSAQYAAHWQWGPAAAILHFSSLNSKFMSLRESSNVQLEKSAVSPSPDLYWPEQSGSYVERDRSNSQISPLLELMARRRTVRSSKKVPISKNQLIECLFAGLGITGFTKTETCTLPLKMTPSGGARNPYEAYVYVKNVANVTPGFYHFSAIDGRLKLVSKGRVKNTGSLLADQDWAEETPAVIFLVAIMERTMWKYPDPNAYRVLLIEAGHIAQNIMLAATAYGLSACPTAALSHEKISMKIGLKNITQAPIYALTLGHPNVDPDPVIANHQLRSFWCNLTSRKTSNEWQFGGEGGI